MHDYLMYLRKSQTDRDYEDESLTLSRHKSILTDFAAKNNYSVAQVFEEVVSGESLSARPEMQKCLELVNTGEFSGIICMDIDRLSRGSSFDSGYIMQCLQVNHCKIITPTKTYDLEAEYDEQFTDLKFMFARMELKTISKRLTRGRKISVSEGKWISCKLFGYDRVKLEGTKGYKLVPNSDAIYVKKIYQMYEEGYGSSVICDEMKRLGVKPPRKDWTPLAVLKILTNPTYTGVVSYGKTVQTKTMQNGVLTKKRVSNPNPELYEGLHEAIISKEDFERVQNLKNSKPHTTSKSSLINPFAGIVRCAKCGHVLTSVTCKQGSKSYITVYCRYKDCDNHGISLDKLEDLVTDKFKDAIYNVDTAVSEASEHTDDKVITQQVKTLEKALSDALKRQEKLCEYLESGTYSLELFEKRNLNLENEIKNIKTQIAELSKPKETKTINPELAEKYSSLLVFYDTLSVQEKNEFWKSCIKAIYFERKESRSVPQIKIDWI